VPNIANRRTVVTEGLFKIIREPTMAQPTYDIVIEELPITSWSKTYRKMLEKWIDEGKLGKLIDNSNIETQAIKLTLIKLNTRALQERTVALKPGKTGKTAVKPGKKPKITKVPETKAQEWPPPPLTLEMLKLRKTFSLNQMVMIDDNGNPVLYTGIEQILVTYTHRMLEHYNLIKMTRISNLQQELQKAKLRYSLIDAIVSGVIKIFNKPESEIIAHIRLLKLDEKSFDELKMRDATKEKLDSIAKKISELEDSLKHTEKLASSELWKQRILALLQVF
jgi:hypothetical protein